jgi:sugar lactone lactonase YvrE
MAYGTDASIANETEFRERLFLVLQTEQLQSHSAGHAVGTAKKLNPFGEQRRIGMLVSAPASRQEESSMKTASHEESLLNCVRSCSRTLRSNCFQPRRWSSALFTALLLLLLASSSFAQSQIITTVVGPTTPPLSLPLNQPHGIATDSKGNLYIADTNNCVVWQLPIGYQTATVFAGQLGNCGVAATAPTGITSPTSIKLNFPLDVAACNGTVFILDQTSGSGLYKVDAGGNFSSLVPPFHYSPNHTVRGPGNPPAIQPQAIACDAVGDLFIQSFYTTLDGAIYSLDELSSTGVSSNISEIFQGVGTYIGVAADPQGNVYTLNVSALGYGFIYKFTTSGSSSIISAVGLVQCSSFFCPVSPTVVATDGFGDFYVNSADTADPTLPTFSYGLNMIDEILLSGGSYVFDEIAGDGVSGFNEDGPDFAFNLELNHPMGISATCTQVLIADTGNNRIRAIPPNPGTCGPSAVLTLSANSALPSTPVTLTATATVASIPATGGTVSFFDGNVLLGVSQIISSSAQGGVPGTAVFTARFGSGTHMLTAVFKAPGLAPRLSVPPPMPVPVQGNTATSNEETLTVGGSEGTQTLLSAQPDPSTANPSTATNFDFLGSVFGFGIQAPQGTLGLSASGSAIGAPATLAPASFPPNGLPYTFLAQSQIQNAPTPAAAGDLNGDGIPDLVVFNGSGSTGTTFGVLLGVGDGSFQKETSYCLYDGTTPLQPGPCANALASQPAGAIIADVNGDGIPDVIVFASSYSGPGTGLSTEPGAVLVYLGTGGGNLNPVPIVTSGFNAGFDSLTSGDVNNDGMLDLVVTSQIQQTVTVLLGHGDGTFSVSQSIPVTAPSHSVIADFNQDGHPDIVTTNYLIAGQAALNSISLMLGSADGTFASPLVLSYPTSLNSPSTLLAADLNGDGLPDLAVVSANGVSIFLNNKSGTNWWTFGQMGFSPPVNYPVGVGPETITAGDLNGDGYPDLFVGNSDNSLSVLLSSGPSSPGTFLPAQNMASFGGSFGLVDADFNGDSVPDLAAVSFSNPFFQTNILLGGTESFASTAALQNLFVPGTGPTVVTGAYTPSPANWAASSGNTTVRAINTLAMDTLLTKNPGYTVYAGDIAGVQVFFTPASTTLPTVPPPTGTVMLTATLAGQPPVTTPTSNNPYLVAYCYVPAYSGGCPVNITLPTAGAWTVTASYAGDANWASAISNSVTVNVTQVTTSLSFQNTSPFTAAAGVVFNAEVVFNLLEFKIPTGNVNFTVTNGLSTVIVPSQSAAILAMTSMYFPTAIPIIFPSAGTWTVTANYPGDTLYMGSSASLTVNVTGAAPPPPAAVPTLSPAPGSYSGAQSVTLSSTAGATIYYTTDGTQPTTSSTVYSGPITVSANETITAFAGGTGFVSSATAAGRYSLYALGAELIPGTLSSFIAATPAGSVPSDVAFDASGNFYVLDSGLGTITKFASGTNTNGTVIVPTGTLTNPQFFTVGVDGQTLFVSDYGNNRIVTVSQSSSGVAITPLSLTGIPTPTTISQPTGIFADPNGNLLVADSGNQRLLKLTSTGTYVSTPVTSSVSNGFMGGTFLGVAADNTGNVYFIVHGTPAVVANPGVKVITPSGTVGNLWTIYYGHGIAVDPSGDVYVSDNYRNQVIEFDAVSRSPNILAGPNANGATTPDSGDGGPATVGTFANPLGITLDSKYNVYIADANAQTSSGGSVREVNVSQGISDFASINYGQSTSQPVWFVNPTGQTLTINTLNFGGTNAADFTGSVATPLTLMPGEITNSPTTMEEVTFTPTIFGAESATLTPKEVFSGTPSSLTQSFTLNGTALSVPWPPTITSISCCDPYTGLPIPAGYPGEKSETITVYGTHFNDPTGNGAVPTFNFGPSISVSQVAVTSSTSATMSLDILPSASIGPVSVTVSTGSASTFQGGTATLSGRFSVAPYLPTLSSISASNPFLELAVPDGYPGETETVIVSGTNLVDPTGSNALPAFNFGTGVTATTVSVSGTPSYPLGSPNSTATVNLVISPTAPIGPVSVSVTTGSISTFQGGTGTLTGVFRIAPYLPTITSFSCCNSYTGLATPSGYPGETETVMVTGTNFGDPTGNNALPVFSFGPGVTAKTVSVTSGPQSTSPQTATVNLVISPTAPIGSVTVSVTTGSTSTFQGGTATSGFAIAAYLPKITSIAGDNLVSGLAVPGGYQGQTETVTVIGTNFVDPTGNNALPVFNFGTGVTATTVSVTPGALSTSAQTATVNLVISSTSPPESANVIVTTGSSTTFQGGSYTLTGGFQILASNTPAAPTGQTPPISPVDSSTGASPVTLIFSNVPQPGQTSLTTSNVGPTPPSGFQLGTPPVYYMLSSTVSFTSVEICINYAGLSFTPLPPQLFHYTSGSWVLLTLVPTTAPTTVCGMSLSLSPFALFQASAFPTTTSVSAPGMTYGTPASVIVSVGASGGTVTGSVSLSVDGGGASAMALSSGSATFNIGALSAGSHSLSASFAAQGNFLGSSATGTLSVAPAPLTIAANNAARPYGANNPALTGMISGLQNADPITASFSTTAVPANPVGMYSITPVVIDTQNRLSNYSLTLVSGTLTVSPETTNLRLALSSSSILVGQSAMVTVTLTAPDMVIPIDPSVLAPITVNSPIVNDILTNNGTCTPVPTSASGIAACTITLTAVEPNGRTLSASFPGSTALATSAGTADLVVTAPLESKMSCINSDFRNVSVPGGSYLWFNSIFKVRDLAKQKVTITFFQSSVKFQYTDATGTLVKVNQPMPDAKIVIDPSVTSASTMFDPVNNVWITTIPFNLDDNSFLTGLPWMVPAGGLPADVEPVTWCGTFASDTAGIDIGWRWAAAAYSSFRVSNTTLGVKPMNTDDDNSSPNHDNAGTPENFKSFAIPGARGKGGKNYTGSYSGSAIIE